LMSFGLGGATHTKVRAVVSTGIPMFCMDTP
jgi:hypothetical protein